MTAGSTPETYMRQALALAGEALDLGEFPIAAIVVLSSTKSPKSVKFHLTT